MLTIKKVSTFFLSFLLVTSFLQAQIGSRISPDKETEERRVSSFHKIEVSSALTVFIRQGEKESLRVEATPKMLPQITTKVKGGILHIYVEGRAVFKGNPEIYLTFKELDGIKVSGASRVEADGKSNFEDIRLSVSGASKLEMVFTAKDVDINLSGASRLRIKGKATDISASISGASSLKADEMKAERVKVRATGASSAKVAASGELEATASGASAVRYKGDPKNIDLDAGTASSIKVMEY